MQHRILSLPGSSSDHIATGMPDIFAFFSKHSK